MAGLCDSQRGRYDAEVNWAHGYLAATGCLCLLVFRIFYRNDLGPRPVVATGCAGLTFIGCMIAGLYLLAISGIGGSVGF